MEENATQSCKQVTSKNSKKHNLQYNMESELLKHVSK